MQQTRRRYLLLILLAVLAVGGAGLALMMQRGDPGIAQSGEKLFPDLLPQLDEVTRIEHTYQGETTTLKFADGIWKVMERDEYPAETSEVRELLVGMAEFVRVEPKTARPEHYKRLELRDPTNEESAAIGYVLQDEDGEVLADLVSGKRRFIATTPGVDEYFVRVGDRPRAWLVTGKIPRHRQSVNWLQRSIADIDQLRVWRAEVTHADGTVVRVAKPTRADGEFELEGVPEGHEIDKDFQVHAFGTFFTSLVLNDVAKPEEVDFSDRDDTLRVVLETFDGVRITMRTGTLDERTFIRVTAEYDPAIVAAAPGAGEPFEEPLLDEAAARAEVEELNRRWEGWVYEPQRFTLDGLRRKVEDLVKPIEEEKKGDGSAAASSPSGTSG